MDASTLSKLTTYITLQRCRELMPGLYEAWDVADVNTVNRRAGWFSQVLEESGGLAWTTELASGSEYEGRTDLGNTQPGDGVRFKGRGFIQVTGRAHYRDFGVWCHKRGLVPSDDYFLLHPDRVADDRFAWISVAWYWIGNHNHGYDYLNKAADARDLVAMTYMVNGGQNGLATRQYYYNRALGLGAELMSPPDPSDPNWSDSVNREQILTLVDERAHALMHGDNRLNKDRPATYGKDGGGVDDRLQAHHDTIEDHRQRIVALEKKVKP